MASKPHIRSLLLAQPFVPFAVRLADGTLFEIPHREFASLQQKSLNLIVSTPDDATHYVDIPNIVDVEVSPEGVRFAPPSKSRQKKTN